MMLVQWHEMGTCAGPSKPRCWRAACWPPTITWPQFLLPNPWRLRRPIYTSSLEGGLLATDLRMALNTNPSWGACAGPSTPRCWRAACWPPTIAWPQFQLPIPWRPRRPIYTSSLEGGLLATDVRVALIPNPSLGRLRRPIYTSSLEGGLLATDLRVASDLRQDFEEVFYQYEARPSCPRTCACTSLKSSAASASVHTEPCAPPEVPAFSSPLPPVGVGVDGRLMAPTLRAFADAGAACMAGGHDVGRARARLWCATGNLLPELAPAGQPYAQL